jgi:hypothetical protein
MLNRVTFILENGSNRRYTHFIEPDGLIQVITPFPQVAAAKVAVLVEDGGAANSIQLYAMALVCRCAAAFNPDCVYEFTNGLCPYAEPPPFEPGMPPATERIYL